MRFPSPKTCAAVVAVILAGTSESMAQEWLHLNPIEGEVRLEFDGEWERQGSVDSQNLGFTERVRIGQGGYILDPGIAAFQFEFEPAFTQDRFSGPGEDSTSNGLFLDYFGSLSLLRDGISPLGLIASASRNSGEIDGSLGNQTDFVTDVREVLVDWKSRAFPSTLGYTERLQDQKTESAFGGATSERDDVIRILRYDGRSSKMNLQLESKWFDDNINSDRDYTSQQARLLNHYRWGKGSRFASNVNFLNRDGFNANERYSVNENLQLKHLENLSTSYNYSFNALASTNNQTTHSGKFGLSHRLYRNLSTGASLSGTHSDFDQGQQDDYNAQLDLNYTKGIFWGGTLGAHVGGGYGATDRDSEPGTNDVIDESHLAEISGIVLLDERFIVTSTIIVTDVTGSVIFTEGFDYTISDAGGDLTELLIIPAAGIAVGDTILVSYEFEIVTSAKYDRLSYRFGLDLDFDWISLFHRTSGEEQDLKSGNPDAVRDSFDSTTGIEMRWRGRRTGATLTAEKRFRDDGDFESDETNFSQTLFYDMAANARLDFNAYQSLTESEGGKSESYRADLSVNWRPLRNLTVRPSAGAFFYQQKGEDEDIFLTAGLDIRWVWRRLEVELNYDHNHRDLAEDDIEEDRVMLTVTRRF